MARRILKQIFLSVKFDVIDEIYNGGAAIEKLKNPNLHPDYLFIDVEMPVLNGVEVVNTVRSILPGCRIVMVASHGKREKIEELIKPVINGYIKKPFDRDTVIYKLSVLR